MTSHRHMICGLRAFGVLLALTVTAATPSVAFGAHTGPLLGQWHLDENVNDANCPDDSCFQTHDSSGHGHHSEPRRPVDLGPGRFGNALVADEFNSYRMVDSPALKPARLTLLAWVRSSSDPGDGRVVAGLGGGGGSCAPPAYGMSTINNSLSFSLRTSADGRVQTLGVPTGRIWNGDWHMVAGTFDGETARLYLDGTQVGQARLATSIDYTLADTRFTVGDYVDNSSCEHDTSFRGGIDEVRVYNRALSAAEVGRMARAPGPDPPVLESDESGRQPPPAAPRVTSVEPVALTGRNRPTLLSAKVSGQYQELRWNLAGDGRPEMVSKTGQTAMLFRPRPGKSVVSVTPVGPGGAGPAIPVDVSAPPADGSEFSKAVTKRLAARPPVYAVGPEEGFRERGIVGPPRPELCLIAPVTVKAGMLEMTGCLTPITSVDDIPPKERGILEEIARNLAPNPHRYLDLADGFRAIGSVTVNGVTLSPRQGATIVLYPKASVIASSNAGLSVGRLKLVNPDRFVLDTEPVGGQIPLGSFARAAGPVKGLGGFRLFGDVQVALTPEGARIRANLELPEWLTSGGVRFSSAVDVRATNDRGLILDSMRIGPLDADLGALSIQGFRIDYAREDNVDVWRGQGKACVISGTCLDMIPARGSVVIKNGGLDFAGATLDFPPPGAPLFAGVNLESVGFNFGLNPTRTGGRMKVSVLEVYEIDGRLTLAFPSPATPYVFDKREVGAGFPENFYGRRHTRATIGIAADASLKAPLVGSIRLGGGYFLYEYPGYVAFGGGINQDFLVAKFKGYLQGEINTDNRRYNIFGKTETCITPLVCYGGDVVVSSRGAAGCVRPGVLPDFGLGVLWNPYQVVPQLISCKWSPFAEFNVKGSAATAQAGDPLEVRIRAGDPGRTLRLDGARGAPRVRVTGPGGQVLESGAQPYAARGALRILQLDKVKTTAVGLEDPQPGVYRIEPLPGSTAVTKVAQAIEPAAAEVSARVRGRGTQRVLDYAIRRRKGQRVTFVELDAEGGARPIGTVDGGGRGKLRFAPAPGRGVRRIEARFELAGLAAERKFVARFAPPSPRLARPRQLRVRRRGTSLHVSWAGVAGARRYEVVASSSGTGSRMRGTRGRRAVVRGIGRSSAGRVTVRAVDRLRAGPPAKARFRRTSRRKTRFGPLGRCRVVRARTVCRRGRPER